jgi:hypothetical protein
MDFQIKYVDNINKIINIHKILNNGKYGLVSEISLSN